MTWPDLIQYVSSGVMVLGLPELVLLLIAVYLTAILFHRTLAKTKEDSTEQKVETSSISLASEHKLFATSLRGPAFIVHEGHVIFYNAASQNIQGLDRFHELAIEAASKSATDGHVLAKSEVPMGGRTFGLRAIGLSGSNVLVHFEEVGANRSRFAKLMRDVTHEVKGPVSTISGLAGEVLDQLNDIQKLVGDSPGLQDLVQRIKNQADKSLTVITQQELLGHLRDPEFAATLSFKPVNMRQLVQTCVQSLEERENDVRITREFAQDIPTPLGQRYLLERVLDNLLDNAVKYSIGTVSITVNLDHTLLDGYISCQVIDKGRGIPKELHSKIFDDGFRVANMKEGVAPSVEGSGFGLVEVKRIVQEIHNGQIEVKSTVGEGSTFTFHLPCGD